MTEMALDGLRIVDLSEGVAGGYCTRLLAGLGADVVKVEHPRTGDPLRRAGPFLRDVPHPETSAPHLHLNAAKRSITLDPHTATGLALLLHLLIPANAIVMERPPSPAFAPDALDARFPSLVVTTITSRGLDGSLAGRASTEITDLALSGYLSLNGDPDREPVKVYGSQAQLQAGLHAALGTMAALAARDRVTGGVGQHVDVAAVEAAGFLLAGAIQRHAIGGIPQRRNGPRPASFRPTRLYPSTVRPCADGHVHVHCHNRFHDLISVLMEEPRLAAAEVLAEPLGHAAEIDALMDGWLAGRDRATAVSAAQDLRIPMTEVLTPAEVVEDALGQHAARGFLVDVEHPVAGTVRQPGAPVRMHGTPWRTARAPLLGEHNRAVYCDELGLTPGDLARLAAAAVI